MTYYRRAVESQRQDPELRAAIKAELTEQFEMLKLAAKKLEEAYKLMAVAQEIEEDNLDKSSGLYEAKLHVRQAISRFNYKIDNPANETYIGNAAALMSPEKARELKEKYNLE